MPRPVPARRRGGPGAYVRVLAGELVRRFGLRSRRTRAHLTDAEVWVSPEVWAQAVALVDEAARLVHAEAQPPRSAGTVHVNLSAALFAMTRRAMRLPDALAPLRDRRFAWYFAARVTSTAGSAMAPVALAFAVLDLSGSAAALGVVLAARTLPMVLFLLVGGVVSDRFSRSTVMRTSNILSGLTQATVARW